ncbi:MAG TPA: LytTR family DNA-binding domain-containing protein [Chitinophagaceae bacterium]|nr:LytTR family DNA-binding domain-containing protein [Chitinophagaceae bacterium]
MIQAIIIDDEPGNIDVLKKLITDFCEDIEIPGTAASVEEGINLIKERKPDLVFLDIEMPGKNAFDLIDYLTPVAFEIIFVTAFEHYALKAFRYSAIDYLLKPVNIRELREAIEKARIRIKERNFQARLNNFFDIERKKENKIAIQLKDGYSFINYNDIVCCSAEGGGYTVVYLVNGNKLLSGTNLKHFEELLPDDIFCRIHNAYLVNLQHAVHYSKGRNGKLLMVNKMMLEVSQRKKDELLNRFSK